MRTEKMLWTKKDGGMPDLPGPLALSAGLPLFFSFTSILEEKTITSELTNAFPNAQLLGGSTACEISGLQVHDDTLVVTVIHFEHSRIQGVKVSINSKEESFRAGETLAKSLEHKGLVHVLALSESLIVNGSELVKGLFSQLPDNVYVTGWLSGDGDRFAKTLVALNGHGEKNTIAALGFYGNRLQVGYGSLVGWDPFGPERIITRSDGNTLYELDGKSALDLYKQYLGKHAEGLPATGLLFPLSLRIEGRKDGLVRIILAVNEEERSMTFTGDVPEGAYARLMKANFDRLVDGATGAAKLSYSPIGSVSPNLALLISGIGRKIILKQRMEEEVEAVQEVLGPETVLTGFYSYGEISPDAELGRSELHNQTMTITVFSER